MTTDIANENCNVLTWCKPAFQTLILISNQTVRWINKMAFGMEEPRPRPHCVRWGPSRPSPSKKGGTAPNVCCGQTAGWIKMSLGKEVGLDPGDTVLDGDPAPPERGTAE